MNYPFLINKMLSKSLARMANHAEKRLSRNNLSIQALKDTILLSNRTTLLTLKAGLLAFTDREAERNFDNLLIGIYLQLIDQHLRKKPID